MRVLDGEHVEKMWLAQGIAERTYYALRNASDRSNHLDWF